MRDNAFVLALDQASNFAGCSLWKNGELVACTVLKSNKASDPLPRRLQEQVKQLEDWLYASLPCDGKIETVLFEGVKLRLVMVTVGAYLCVPQLENCRINQSTSFVGSTSWKSWARKQGATGETMALIKGVNTLREIGFDVDKHSIVSDDIADSIMIYKAWEQQQKGA